MNRPLRHTTEIKQEVRALSSQWMDGSQMYPGRYLFTWIKTPHMPWVLAGIEQVAVG